jgi:non-structural maintenance of chromosomes element 4
LRLDSRADYLQSASRGIAETVEKANELYKNVKQTSDATIDSRLLVSAADLSYKKTTQLALGDASAGIDVDEFVSKCITFMKQGPTGDEPDGATQPQRTRRRIQNDEVDEGDDGDALNWDWLGRQACFPHNMRPPVSGFLLGPLSVQKKVRQQTQRKAREARRNPADAVRPEEIQAKDLEKESTNLTTLCEDIYRLLAQIQSKGNQDAEAELEERVEMDDNEVQDMLARHNMADTGGVPLFKFCVSPKSFGQTVENLFYVSFLIKEGRVGLEVDSRGIPSLS